LPTLGKRFFTAALTFFCSAGVPFCATLASASRACALSGIWILSLTGQGERFLTQLLAVFGAEILGHFLSVTAALVAETP
jgi:hypothetical protein